MSCAGNRYGRSAPSQKTGVAWRHRRRRPAATPAAGPGRPARPRASSRPRSKQRLKLLGYRQHVTGPALFQPVPQRRPFCIRRPRQRRPSRDGTQRHRPRGQSYCLASSGLVANSRSSGMPADLAAVPVIGPRLRQVQLPVDQRLAPPLGNRHRPGTPRPVQFSTRPCRAGVLPLHPGGPKVPFFRTQVSSVISTAPSSPKSSAATYPRRSSRTAIGSPRVVRPRSQQPLHPIRSRITGELRDRPPVLPLAPHDSSPSRYARARFRERRLREPARYPACHALRTPPASGQGLRCDLRPPRDRFVLHTPMINGWPHRLHSASGSRSVVRCFLASGGHVKRGEIWRAEVCTSGCWSSGCWETTRPGSGRCRSLLLGVSTSPAWASKWQ